MKHCKKCNQKIPTWFKIDNKWKNLHSRVFCLTCSPYKMHNTINLSSDDYTPIFITKNDIKHKKCSCCKLYLEVNDKNYHISKNGKIYSHCKSCGTKKTITRQKQLKQKCVDYKGGKCVVCGYNKYIGALDFHHIDPTQKEYSISDGRCFNFDKIKKELEKCILLCSNCHKELHGKFSN